MEDNVLVFPNCLRFKGNDPNAEDFIIISSAWSEYTAYRITVSAASVFRVPKSEGYLPPCQSVRIPVHLKHMAVPADGNVKFAVDLADVKESDVDEDDPQAFWLRTEPVVRRSITCEFTQDNTDDKSSHGGSLASHAHTSRTSASVLPPKGHVLDLMVKNVSKNNPLTEEETEELKSVRSIMTKDQWTSWLKFAREEKRRRDLHPEDNQDSGHSVDGNGVGDGVHGGRYPGADVKTARPMSAPRLTSRPTHPVRQSTDVPTTAPAPPPRVADMHHKSSASPSPARSTTPGSGSRVTKETTAVGSDSPHPRSPADSQRPSWHSGTLTGPRATSSPTSMPDSLSTKATLKGVILANSKPAQPIGHPSDPTLSSRAGSRTAHLSVPTLNRDEDIYEVSPLKQCDRLGYPHESQYHNEANTVPTTRRLGGSPTAVSRGTPMHTSSRSQGTLQQTQPKSVKRTENDDTNAIVKSSTLRIDSAFAAAQCLKASLEADLENESVPSDKTSSALAMVTAMMKSLEKSKSSLEHLNGHSGPGDVSHTAVPRQEGSVLSSDGRQSVPVRRSYGTQEQSNSADEEASSQCADDLSETYSQGTSYYDPRFDRNKDTDTSTAAFSVKELRGMSTTASRRSSARPFTDRRWAASNRFSTPGRISAVGSDGDAGSTTAASARRMDNAPLYHMRSRHGDQEDSAIISRKSQHAVRSAKGMPRVMKLCVSEGPQIKAYDENPIRIDVENCALDIVWRERHGALPGRYSANSSVGSRASTLRRERYCFDDIYAGPDAISRLYAYTRKRTKAALLSGRGLAFLCLAGGECVSRNTVSLEPTVSLVVGDSGGHGLMSAVVEEIFKSKNIPYSSKGHTPYGKQSLASGAISGDDTALQSCVVLTAVTISDGIILDLLGPPGSIRPERGMKQCRVSRRADGSYHVANATPLKLKSAADFERVAGVLLGRRAALREIAPSLLEWGDSVGSTVEVPVPETPWMMSADREACILFSLSTTGEGVSTSSHRNVSFHFACPCGPHWDLPAEAISTLPHSPPPSLLNAGLLTQILVDPHSPDIDYVTVASVVKSTRSGSRPSVQEDEEMIRNMLQSFRVVSQLSTM